MYNVELHPAKSKFMDLGWVPTAQFGATREEAYKRSLDALLDQAVAGGQDVQVAEVPHGILVTRHNEKPEIVKTYEAAFGALLGDEWDAHRCDDNDEEADND